MMNFEELEHLVNYADGEKPGCPARMAELVIQTRMGEYIPVKKAFVAMSPDLARIVLVLAVPNIKVLPD